MTDSTVIPQEEDLKDASIDNQKSDALSAIRSVDATDYQGNKNTSLRANFRFVWLAALVGFSQLEYGFDHMLSSFQAMVGFLEIFGYRDPRVPAGYNIAAGPQQIIGSFMLLGAFIASLGIGYVGNYLGRRHGIILGCVLLVVSLIMMVVTTDLPTLYASRLIIGLGNGFIVNYSYIYVSEVAPPYFRGLSYGVLAAWVTLGTGIGLVITNGTASMAGRISYQLPLYILFGMPAVIFCTLPFLPESPRWLLLHGREEAALKSLTWIRNGAYDKLALQQEFEEMKLNAERELENKKTSSIFDLFRAKNIRRTLIAAGIGCANPASGAIFIMGFGTYFFKVTGITEPFKWVIVGQFVGLFGQIVNFFVVDLVGRRKMMLTGGIICAFSMLLLGILSTQAQLKGTSTLQALVIFIFSIFLFGFNFGLAPCSYLVAGEIPAQNLRGYTAGLSTAMGFLFAWLTAYTAPYFVNPAELNWGGRYGFVWFGAMTSVILFIFFFLPEMQGRTLEEIEEMFDKGIAAKDFPTYVCTNAVLAREEAERDLFGNEKAAALHAGDAQHIEDV